MWISSDTHLRSALRSNVKTLYFSDVAAVRTDRHTPEQRSRNMQAVRSKNSKIEMRLRQALWGAGIRYRLHVRKLPGNPDIVIAKHRIVIFVDSEFWHGHDWDKRRHDFKSNQEFWLKKIERNMHRDEEVNQQLATEGWTVLRFWGNEITTSLERIVSEVQRRIEST